MWLQKWALPMALIFLLCSSFVSSKSKEVDNDKMDIDKSAAVHDDEGHHHKHKNQHDHGWHGNQHDHGWGGHQHDHGWGGHHHGHNHHDHGHHGHQTSHADGWGNTYTGLSFDISTGIALIVAILVLGLIAGVCYPWFAGKRSDHGDGWEATTRTFQKPAMSYNVVRMAENVLGAVDKFYLTHPKKRNVRF